MLREFLKYVVLGVAFGLLLMALVYSAGAYKRLTGLANAAAIRTELAVEQERRLMDAAVWYDRESGYIREVEELRAELVRANSLEGRGYTFDAKVGIWLNGDTALAITDASLYCSDMQLTPLGDTQVYDIPQETP